MGSESKGGGAAGAALFVLPKADRIGGAERVTITAAVGAARSGRFEEVVLLVLTGGRGAAEAVAAVSAAAAEEEAEALEEAVWKQP